MSKVFFVSIMICVVLFFTIPGMAQKDSSVHAFTVQQCIDYAMKNNVQVKNALLDVKIQEQINRNVTAAAYPQINGTISATHFPNVTVQSFPNFIAAATYGVLTAEGVKDGDGNTIVAPADFGYVQAAFGTKWNASAGITLSQLLFDGQVFVGLQARKATMNWKAKAVEVTQEAIKANIYKIYYQLAASKTQTDQLDANVQRLEKLQHDVTELYKNGFAEKLEIDKATVQLTNLQTERTSALNSINNGYLGLKLLMGMPVTDVLTLTDSYDENKVKEGLLNEGSYQYEDRKEYQYLTMARDLGAFNVRRYRLSKLPTVALSGSYSKLAQRNQFDFFGKGQWFSSSFIGLNINVPIFDGFAKDANMQKAKLELQQTDNQISNLKQTIDNEVAVAENNYHNAINTLDVQKKNMDLAEQIYNQTKTKFEAGTGSNLEISNAQADLKVAQSNYINAMYTAIIAKVDYMKAIGKL